MGSDSGEPIEIIKEGYDAFARNDVERVLALIAPDFELYPARDPDGQLRAFVVRLDAFNDRDEAREVAGLPRGSGA